MYIILAAHFLVPSSVRWDGYGCLSGFSGIGNTVETFHWNYACSIPRFTNAEDKQWFDNAVLRVGRNEMGEEYAERIQEEPYFVDFLRDPPEPTGEEADDAALEAPKIYEKVGT